MYKHNMRNGLIFLDREMLTKILYLYVNILTSIYI
ncbi:hypothetical protein PFDG_04047 [Plasmodium falciparum Dd2]|uniref:Uncharacterized protein n=1 Tax=Plasmodium falciparum (isolate Dd2) TaxID=57267 RepID=A0A0L7M4N6_PLAF4|nr:hypothetical protein PFDG_04047 [Plasmodium falciparum Dd2]